MRPRHLVISVLTTLFVAASACAAPQSGQATGSRSDTSAGAGPKRIVAAIRGDPHTLSDAINFAAGGSSSAGVREIEQLLNGGLLVLDSDGNLQGQLAETAPTLDNGLWKVLPDGRMETTWTIKKNAMWHDGAPVTTHDLEFTATVAQDKTQAMSQDAGFKYLESLQPLDDQTITAVWSSTFVDADKLFTQTTNTRNLPMPAHLLEAAYNQDRATFVDNSFFGPDYIGTGPYKLKEWVVGTHLVLEANDNYILGRPKIDGIEVKFILDTNTMVANLVARALDMTMGRGLTPEQAITVREQWKEGTVDAGLQNTTSLYPQFMDTDPPILADARFRRALLMATDRQEIVDSLLGGLVPVADSIYSPDDPEYKELLPAMIKYPYDPRAATAALDEIGLGKGADGFYVDGSGKKISIEIRTRSHPLREKVQQVLADEWGKVGIEGDPTVIPEQRINDRAYQATFPAFYFRFGDPNQFTEWMSNDAPTAANNYVGRNILRYQNPDYDALILRLQAAIQKPERMRVLSEMTHIFTDQLILMPLYHEPEPVLISDRMINVGGRRGSGIQAWNAQLWDIKS